MLKREKYGTDTVLGEYHRTYSVQKIVKTFYEGEILYVPVRSKLETDVSIIWASWRGL